MVEMAVRKFGFSVVEEGYALFDDATRSWWVSPARDVARLGQMVEEGVPDAYSVWCSETSAREMPSGWTPDEG